MGNGENYDTARCFKPLMWHCQPAYLQGSWEHQDDVT